MPYLSTRDAEILDVIETIRIAHRARHEREVARLAAMDNLALAEVLGDLFDPVTGLPTNIFIEANP